MEERDGEASVWEDGQEAPAWWCRPATLRPPLTLVAGASRGAVFSSSATMSCISTSALWLPDSFCSTERPAEGGEAGSLLPPQAPPHTGRLGTLLRGPVGHPSRPPGVTHPEDADSWGCCIFQADLRSSGP